MIFNIRRPFFLPVIAFCHILLCTKQSVRGQENNNFVKLHYEFGSTISIAEGPKGYIWFADTDGIYKYNGSELTYSSYDEILGQDFSPSSSYTLYRNLHDSSKNIWIFNNSGEISRIDSLGKFTSYKNEISARDKNNYITSIAIRNGITWLSTSNNSIYKYTASDKKLIFTLNLENIHDTPIKIKDIAIIDDKHLYYATVDGEFYEYNLFNKTSKRHYVAPKKIDNLILFNDSRDQLWILTQNNGLLKYNPVDEVIEKRYGYKGENDNKSILFTCITESPDETIWVGTDGDGLYRIKKDMTILFQTSESNPSSISNNTIISLCSDTNGNIILNTKKNTINILPNNSNKTQFRSGLKNNASLAVDVLSCFKSSDRSLWIGTDGKGLNRVFSNGHTVQYPNGTTSRHSNFKGEYITSINEDSHENLWIGTYTNGLWVYNLKSDTFVRLPLFNRNRPIYEVQNIYIDSKNRIWVSVFGTLLVYENPKKLIARFDYAPYSLSGTISETITEDEQGNIWIGILNGGLYKFVQNRHDIQKSYFTKYNYYLKEQNDSKNYNPKYIRTNNHGLLYIITTSGDLIQFALDDHTFKNLSESSELSGKDFKALLFNGPDDLWLTGHHGIFNYNTKSKKLNSFSLIDGLVDHTFPRFNAFKDFEGSMYFLGERGVNIIKPKLLRKHPNPINLYINEIEIMNRPLSSVIEENYNEITENIKNIDLSYHQSSFSFKFSAIGNILHSNYRYQHRLKNFDQGWINTRQNNRVTYTNIPYGKYTLEVRGSSVPGKWDIKPITLQVNISPPWRYSKTAYLIYLLILAGIVYGISAWIRLKNRLALKARENKKEKEIYDLKVNFFTRMSHEIQTPITLILGPLDDMLFNARKSGNMLLSQRLKIIKNNTGRLSRIATILTLIRNKELDQLHVQATKNKLSDHLREVSESFKEHARFKKIDFIQEYPNEDIELWYDRDMIDHVFYNLLGNAFKFTPANGEILLKAVYDRNEKTVEIVFKDSGPGIEKHELEQIFTLFYRSEAGKKQKGAGIGLALVKELIDLHYGNIEVVSSPDTGTEFKIILSTDEYNLSPEQKINTYTPAVLAVHNAEGIDLEEFYDEEQSDLPLGKILIVEDNVDMQIMLQEVFSKSFEVIIAEDGERGETLAKQHQPHLILCDVMLPKMNGIVLSKAIKSNAVTSHIPIILMTAKNSETSRFEGLKSGAVEYIYKPFHFNELYIKVKNIVIANNNIANNYKIRKMISPKVEASALSRDDQFIKDLIEEISGQIENPNFKLEDLSAPLNMSYSTIYRKCFEITGKSVFDIYRTLRLKKAAILILKNNYSINEAGFTVNYKDAKYFRKCFKKEFDQTPMNMKKEALKNGIDNTLEKNNIISDNFMNT